MGANNVTEKFQPCFADVVRRRLCKKTDVLIDASVRVRWQDFFGCGLGPRMLLAFCDKSKHVYPVR